MANLILTDTPLGLQTRRKSDIANHMSRRAPYAGVYKEQTDRETEFPNAKRRKVGPCNTYNCHGLTFGARRTAIPSSINLILKEDDYSEVAFGVVMPGDIVIYRSTGAAPGSIAGDIEHSGIVLERTALGNVLVLSKWGFGDEWVHFLRDCPYDSGDVKYFRINDCPPIKTS
jgi:hypothetical protein